MTLHGATELRAKFRAIKPTGGMLRELQLAALTEEKRLAPVKTGNLRRTIRPGRVTSGGFENIATAGYAAPVEFGAAPHVIRPRRRKVLRFRVGGTEVFARMVRHPGNRAQPFMRPGLEKVVKDIGGIIVRAWNRAR